MFTTFQLIFDQRLVITGLPHPGDDGDSETPPVKKQPLPVARDKVAHSSSKNI